MQDMMLLSSFTPMNKNKLYHKETVGLRTLKNVNIA